jgi:beta-N-acetylhexosaminidase
MIPADTGAFIFGCEGPVLLPSEARFFRTVRPWGFILFARNIEAPDQVRRLTAQLREAVGWAAPVLIDQEGGRVQRLRAPHWREWLPPLEQMETARDPLRAMELRARLIAHELHAIGIDVNCAPTADLATALTHPFLRNRTLGTSPEQVSAAARAVVAGHAAGGVLSVLKHIPGHGRGTADSHHDLPHVDVPRATLDATDFAVFHALRDVSMGMTAHVVYTDIDARAPATTSPRMHRVIREEIGFGGLLMTDDLSMNALPGDIATRARDSIAAGCDVILHCNGERPEMEAVVAAAGALSPVARARAEAALAMRETPAPLDIAAVEADLEALLNS